MSLILKALLAGIFVSVSSSVQASSIPASDTTPQMAYEDISRSLPELEPITFQASAERHKLLVFVDN